MNIPWRGYQWGGGGRRMGEKVQGISSINGRYKIDRGKLKIVWEMAVSYTHLTLPTNVSMCRSRWSPYH